MGGGKRVHPLGIGDVDGNIEEDFVKWKEAFWTSVCEEFGLESLGDDFSMRQYEATILQDGDYKPERVFTGEVARLRSYQTQRPPFDVKNPFLAPIKVNRNLHSDDSDRYCMHVEIGLEESRIRYEAGDHVAIYPTNDVQLVNRIGQFLEVDLDTVFTMTALKHYVDITALPRTHVLKELAEYTSDESEKSKLLTMCSNTDEGREMYNNWIAKDCRHIMHILEDLPSCKISMDHLL